MARRLSRFGLPATTLASSGRDLAEQMVSMGPGDVLVAFAFLRTPHHLPEVAAHCADIGARFVLVTDTLGATGESPRAVVTVEACPPPS